MEPVTPNTPFAAAAAAFLEYLRSYRAASSHTLRAYETDLREFTHFLGGPLEAPPPPAVTRDLVLGWAVSLHGLAPSSIRRKLASLASLFSYLQDVGAVVGNPTRRLPLPKMQQRVPPTLSTEQCRGLLSAAALPWEYCALVLLLSTGLRRGELAAARCRDVDLLAETLLVHGKGGKERMLPLPPIAVTAIALYLPSRRARPGVDALLVNRAGRPVTGHLLWRMLARSLHRAGIDVAATPHHLRHTFATRLIREGVDVRTVQELLGHASLQTTARYLHSDVESKRRAVQIAGDALKPAPHPAREPVADALEEALREV